MNVNSVGNATAMVGSSAFPNVQTRRDIAEAVNAISSTPMVGNRPELTFVMDRASQEAIIRIIDPQTNEVVMQIPAAYLITLAKALKQPR